MDIESKINRINMLKEERLVERTGLRWNVKPIYEGNRTSIFSEMRNQLTIKKNNRLTAKKKGI